MSPWRPACGGLLIFCFSFWQVNMFLPFGETPSPFSWWCSYLQKYKITNLIWIWRITARVLENRRIDTWRINTVIVTLWHRNEFSPCFCYFHTFIALFQRRTVVVEEPGPGGWWAAEAGDAPLYLVTARARPTCRRREPRSCKEMKSECMVVHYFRTTQRHLFSPSSLACWVTKKGRWKGLILDQY